MTETDRQSLRDRTAHLDRPTKVRLAAEVGGFLWDDDQDAFVAWYKTLPADQRLYVDFLAHAGVPGHLHATRAAPAGPPAPVLPAEGVNPWPWT